MFPVDLVQVNSSQLSSMLQGLVTSEHDLPMPQQDNPVFSQNYAFRAPAKVGVWKLAKVNGYGLAESPEDSWIAYHSSYGSPLELLLLARGVSWQTRNRQPRVRWVGRFEWGYHCANDLWAAHTLAQLDPGSGWPAANERSKRLKEEKIYIYAGHPDDDRWKRLPSYRSQNTFLVDATHGVEVAKVLARRSNLDTRVAEKESSSFFPGESAREAFGCNLVFMGEGWKSARLIFSEEDSKLFPQEKFRISGFLV
ncbi:hypothetical protein B0H19DRAFT_1257241 [Mycena capillaripes]|nr:hypothetical protein B0H19DRAFT_1257241 [Mycena capillaripes]